jgi:hypothetical protein
MNDIRNYMVAAPQFFRVSHLASLVAGVNQECTLEYGDWIADIKSASKGYPFDLNFVNLKNPAAASGVIEQAYTEGDNGYTDPTNTKKFISSDTLSIGGSGGINWAPLDLDTYDGSKIHTTDTTYQTWQGGKVIATQNLGPVDIAVEQPQSLLVGALGTISVVVHHYYWGTTEEITWYGYQLGKVRWQKSVLTGDVYVPTTPLVFDQVTAGPTPRLVPPTGFVF